MTDPDIYEALVERKVERHRIRGVDYAVNEWGRSSSPLVFYLHGWGDCGATFQFVVDQMQHDWFVIAPDFRGFGESRADASAYWFPDYLADLDALLRIYSPEDPVRIVGHSMGANVAGLYAGAMPDRVVSFVNVEGFGLRDSDPGDAPRRYRDWLQKLREPEDFGRYADYAELAARVSSGNPGMTEAQAEFVARCWAEPGDDGVVLRADPLHRLPNAMLYRRAESEACWRSVTAAVLLVTGGRSTSIRGERLDAASKKMPYPLAYTAVIDDVGHMMHFEAPAELAALIEGFLTGPGRDTAL